MVEESKSGQLEGTDLDSMETVLLTAVAELETSIDNLLMDQFGSHVLRTLFLALSGTPMDSRSSKSILHSKKKEQNGRTGVNHNSNDPQPSSVPESFRETLSRIINAITDQITRESIRNLATDPIGNPTLQLLIELDLGRSRKHKRKAEDSLVGKLLLKLPNEEPRDTEATQSFVKMAVHDVVGSHLIQKVVACVPKKTFVQLYHTHLKGQIPNLVTSEGGSFVAVQVLERLEFAELKVVLRELEPSLSQLLNNHKTAVIRAAIEMYRKHGEEPKQFSENVLEIWLGEYALGGEQGHPLAALFKMLSLSTTDLNLDSEAPKKQNARKAAQLHASLLVQTLLDRPSLYAARLKQM